MTKNLRTHAPTRDLPAPPARLASALAAWFSVHKRDLPWRADRSAYRVWLSEVMLQQTRVSVVEEYFRRFVSRFPDVEALARASEDDVLAQWSGLGYYSRGRNLHCAARVVVEQHGGVFPKSAAALESLPGVGAYTAAAIASLAHHERDAVVDGNVARVLMRLCGDATAIDSPSGKRALAARARALVDVATEPGAHNEAMMELGALVCTPKNARCIECPWRRACVARREESVASLPTKARKAAVRSLDVACLVVCQGDAVWLERRASKGLFGGLYEPPAASLDREGSASTVTLHAVERTWRALARDRGVALPRKLPKPAVVRRQLTHRDLTFHCIRVDAAAPSGSFVARAALGSIGVSAAVRAVLDALWPAPPAQPGLFS